MVVTSFNDSLALDGVQLNPGTRYVLPLDVFQRMINFGQQRGIFPIRHSGFNAFEKRFNPAAANKGDSVVMWRHNAFGDNLMVTGLAAYMKRELGLTVDVYCGPAAIDTWTQMDPDIRPRWLGPSPVPLDPLTNYYKFHIIFNAMLEENRELDQKCGIDDMWQFAGFEPDIANNYRRPMLRLNPGQPQGQEVFLHVHANNCTRTPPLKMFHELAHMLSQKGVKSRFCGVDKKIAARLNQMGMPKGCKNMVGVGKWKDMIYAMEHQCQLLIGPDSALVHLAEGLGIPQIGLWGIFHPDDRVKHYRHHTAITKFEGCPHAPCRWHGMQEFPKAKCGPFNVEGHCNALSNITAEEIMEKIEI